MLSGGSIIVLPPYHASYYDNSHHLQGYFSFNFISRSSSGSRLKSATDRSHCRLSIAGYPLTIFPGATSPGMPLCAVAIAPSPTVQCPATPTWPARITFFPLVVDPTTPTSSSAHGYAPTFVPLPDWPIFSTFTPAL